MLVAGAIALGLAALLLLGYEAYAAFTDKEPTISALTRRWRGHSLPRRVLVAAAPIFIGLCIVFLGIHFGWDSVG